MTPTPDDIPTTPELELLVRHLAGETAPAEAEAVGRWAQASTAHEVTLASLRHVVGMAPVAAEPSDATAVWRRLAPRLAAEPPLALVDRRSTSPSTDVARIPRWLPRAAAAVLTLGAGLVAWQAFRFRPLPPAPALSRPAAFTAPRGQRVVFHLPDGTGVTLAPGSTLHVTPVYVGHDRSVQLEGEAAFTVTHDSTRSFVVRTKQAEVRDLGTRFVVRAYAGDTATEVIVAEGEVALAGARLRRGQLGRVIAAGTAVVRSDVDLERYFGWVDGRLAFRDTPLREAAARLSRWYDIDVKIAAAELGALPLTASFQPDDSPLDAMRLVAVTLDLRLLQLGRSYTLAPR